MKISVVIPTYECQGRGVEFLKRAVASVRMQTFKDWEIVVSDHSIDDPIMRFCRDNDIRYCRNTVDRGSSSHNLNNAISCATGDIIKPLFQDDWLFSPEALQIFHDHFESGAKWVVGGNNTYSEGKGYYHDFIPYWNDELVFGINTLSSPSCMAYIKGDIKWDNRLVWLMDCEFYHRLFLEYGLPVFEERILATNYAHANQYTHLIPKEVKEREVNMIEARYGKPD